MAQILDVLASTEIPPVVGAWLTFLYFYPYHFILSVEQRHRAFGEILSVFYYKRYIPSETKIPIITPTKHSKAVCPLTSFSFLYVRLCFM